MTELKNLGKQTNYIYNYAPEVLETVPNKNDDKNLLLEAFCSEVPVNYVSIERTEESEKYKSFYKSVIDTLSKEYTHEN